MVLITYVSPKFVAPQTPCKISEPYDTPFLEKSNLGRTEEEREKETLYLRITPAGRKVTGSEREKRR
jgi:hypothetical protein